MLDADPGPWLALVLRTGLSCGLLSQFTLPAVMNRVDIGQTAKANTMNKVIHAVVLACFGAACWFICGILRLPMMVAVGGRQLPAFTRFCMGVGPALAGGLAILAAAYCVWVWIRKADSRYPWVSFLATTMAALVLVMLPTIIAILLPLIDAVNHLASK